MTTKRVRNVLRISNQERDSEFLRLEFAKSEDSGVLEMDNCRYATILVVVPDGHKATVRFDRCIFSSLVVECAGGSNSGQISAQMIDSTSQKAVFSKIAVREISLERSRFGALIIDECALIERARFVDVVIESSLLIRWKTLDAACRIELSGFYSPITALRMRDYTYGNSSDGFLHSYTHRTALAPFLKKMDDAGTYSALADFFEMCRRAVFQDQVNKGTLWAGYMFTKYSILAKYTNAGTVERFKGWIRLFLFRHLTSLTSPLSILAAMIITVFGLASVDLAISRRLLPAETVTYLSSIAKVSEMFHGSITSTPSSLAETLLFMLCSFIGAGWLGVLVASLLKRASKS